MKHSGSKWLIIAAVVLVAGGSQSFADATPVGSSYLLYENWGGTWCDAEKSPTNTEDDYMCWAATAANALQWTGWGRVAGVNSDDIFAYFQDHWTDEGGLMQFGWDWWFDGINDSQGWSGWSQVDVPGGGFYPEYTFYTYYDVESSDRNVLSAIDEFLRAGSCVGLGVYGPGGHAITCWGFNYDPNDPTNYYGIWVTDSDDSKSSTSPPDMLRYYEVSYNRITRKWYLQDFYGSDSWYIGEVEALAKLPYDPIMGDIDIDMDVDQSDLDILMAHFGIKSGMTIDDGDLDGDGDVDDCDLNLLLSHYGEVGSLTIIPEPAVMALLLGGGIVLLGRKRSR